MFVPDECGNPSRFKKSGGGVGITPLPFHPLSRGVPPPPLWPGPARDHEPKTTAGKTAPSELPHEQPGISRAETAGMPDPVVGGVAPTPSPFVRARGGYPPWHDIGRVGGTLPSSGRIGRGFRNRSGYCYQSREL